MPTKEIAQLIALQAPGAYSLGPRVLPSCRIRPFTGKMHNLKAPTSLKHFLLSLTWHTSEHERPGNA